MWDVKVDLWCFSASLSRFCFGLEWDSTLTETLLSDPDVTLVAAPWYSGKSFCLAWSLFLLGGWPIWRISELYFIWNDFLFLGLPHSCFFFLFPTRLCFSLAFLLWFAFKTSNLYSSLIISCQEGYFVTCSLWAGQKAFTLSTGSWDQVRVSLSCMDFSVKFIQKGQPLRLWLITSETPGSVWPKMAETIVEIHSREKNGEWKVMTPILVWVSSVWRLGLICNIPTLPREARPCG